MAASVLSHEQAGFAHQAGLRDIDRQRESDILRENLQLEMDMSLLSLELNEYSEELNRAIKRVAFDHYETDCLDYHKDERQYQ